MFTAYAILAMSPWLSEKTLRKAVNPWINHWITRLWQQKKTHYVSTAAGLALAVAVVTALGRGEGNQTAATVTPATPIVVANSAAQRETVIYLVSTQALAEQAWAIERYINELRHFGLLEQPGRSAAVLLSSSNQDAAALRGIVEAEIRVLEGLGVRVTVNDWLAGQTEARR
jgi:hypothetical protein